MKKSQLLCACKITVVILEPVVIKQNIFTTEREIAYIEEFTVKQNEHLRFAELLKGFVVTFARSLKTFEFKNLLLDLVSNESCSVGA